MIEAPAPCPSVERGALECRDLLLSIQWREERAGHLRRMDGLLGEQVRRRARGERHPVYDFIFEYYAFRPTHLFQWSPGPGVKLAGATPEAFPGKGWTFDGQGAWLDPAKLPIHRLESWRWILELLERTAARPPVHACGGLHEWAMVYRGERRHGQVPLRLEGEALAAFVESQPISCTHFDAFRFFTPAARPLNRIQPGRESRLELEQRGCLHVNMDLCKWAAKLMPWIGSELVADCLELALRARELDMQASPYDLRAWGFGPVPMEAPEGRAEFARRQATLAQEAQPLRLRLIQAYRQVIEAAETLSAAQESDAGE